MADPTGLADEQRRRREAEDRAARRAATAFVVSILAAIGLIVVYATGGNTQIEGVLLFVAFAGVGTGLGIWVRQIVGEQEAIEPRYPMRSEPTERAGFEHAWEETLGQAGPGGRRRFLVRLLAGVGASLGLALLLPFRSLGPGPEGELFDTEWREGKRLVNDSGEPIRLTQIQAESVVTVFPEGAVGSPDSQALLIGVQSGRLDRSSLPVDTVENVVVYSKICTHAGCPVGLYRAAVGELLCPCHQSTFDVLHGARVVSGPAGRALPQLPVGVDDEGFLVALGDFNEPVGPSFWDLRLNDGGEA